MNNEIIDIYDEELKTAETHTKGKKGKNKVFTFYLKDKDVDTVQKLIKNNRMKMGEFMRTAIEKAYNIKLEEIY